MTVSRSSPSVSRQRPSDASIERTTSATWWTLPRRRTRSGRGGVRRRAHVAQRTLSAMAVTEACERDRRPGAGPGRARARARAVGPGRGVGVPAHVTILFPFLPPGGPDAGCPGGAGGDRARPSSRSTSRFRDVGRFPTVVYLAPEPSGAVRDADRGGRRALPRPPAVRRRLRRGHPAPDRGRVARRRATRRDRRRGRARRSRSRDDVARARGHRRGSPTAAGARAGACRSGVRP